MEDLIAKFPKEFFPRKELALVGRQGTYVNVGRYDLLFRDEHGTNILMELKARSAKYEDASQLAKYKDALEGHGEKNILMWLVSPQIPGAVRELMDRVGIEYTEIHDAEYRNVAKRHDIQIESEMIRQDMQPALFPDIRPFVEPRSRGNSDSGRHGNRAFRNSIQPKFRSNRERLRTSFPAAYEFLSYPEQHHESGTWLSTSTNAHLYLRDGYLMYIVLGNDSLLLSPHHNNKISGIARNRSKLLFPQVINSLIQSLNGFESGWAIPNHDGSVGIRRAAPREFFTELIQRIHGLSWNDVDPVPWKADESRT